MGNGKSGVKKRKATPTSSFDANIQSGFSQMSVDDAFNIYDKAINGKDINGNDLDLSGLNRGNSLQNLIATLNMHEKPVVLSDSAWDSAVSNEALDGVYLWRGVTDGWGVSAKDVVDHIKYSDKTYIGDGVHGDGLYFTTKQSYAEMYSGNNNDGLIKAYIDKSKANVVTEKNLREMKRQDRTVAQGMDLSSYALYKGYNVIHVPGGNMDGRSGVVGQGNSYRDANGNHRRNGEDYYVPLTRSVLVIRDHAK